MHHRRTPSFASEAEFRELTLHNAKETLHKELDKLIDTAKPENKNSVRAQFDGFERLFSRFLTESGQAVRWQDISTLPPQSVKYYSELTEVLSKEKITDLLSKLVVLKLNGGLGTSMGCTGTKSLIPVRNQLTFLDLTVQQIEYLNKTYDASVPLVLMNSFNTNDETEQTLRKYGKMEVVIHIFNQSKYPRINHDSLMPIARSCSLAEQDAWYPAGHGDVYESFYNSGLMKKFIDEGRQFVFISNMDNLGATTDLNILNFLVNPSAGTMSPEFLMEVTDKTRADIKGGTLVEYEGKLRLLEMAQVPKEHVEEFKSVNKFKIFNTNNLWVNLNSMYQIVQQHDLNLEIIINPKTLDSGLNVLQLETAVGAAIKCFEGAIGINVPRRRFLPVKTTSDLLLMMSNLYTLKQGFLDMSSQRNFQTVPLVKLGTHFTKVKDYLSRFASIPDMLELDHLTVAGDVSFGRGVILKGTVIIIANHGDRIDIPPGAILENKIISGNLRILDH